MQEKLEKTLLKACGVNLAETLKNLNDLHWLNKRILESSDSETYPVKNIKNQLIKRKSKYQRKLLAWRNNKNVFSKKTNPNRKNKHATKVMLSMKLKIVVRKVQKNCEKAATANGLSCQFLKSWLANFLFCFTVQLW